ncbi:MAG: ankyrin repeat domain-containing protein [Planctomycetota bacterium]
MADIHAVMKRVTIGFSIAFFLFVIGLVVLVGIGWSMATGPRLRLYASQGDPTAVASMISRGADVDARGVNGRTPLSLAAKPGHATVVEVLLKAGADPDRPDDDYRNTAPLHLAATHGHVGVIVLLLDAGADIDLPTISTSTPLWFAANFGQHAAVDKLLERGADPDASLPLIQAAVWGDDALVTKLLDAGANINPQDVNGNTPLHYAILGQHTSTANLLIQRGADVTITNARGRTPAANQPLFPLKLQRTPIAQPQPAASP